VAPTIVGTATTDVATPWAPALPSGIAIGDVLLWLGESTGGENFTTPSGWAHVGPNGSVSSPVVQSTNTQLTVFWRLYDGILSAPSVTGPVDHGVSAMLAIRGCPIIGNPWNVGAVSTEAVSDTSAAFPDATTTQADTLVLNILATSADIATAQASTMTNASLGSITELVDVATATGNGGVLVCYSGTKATVGAIGSSAITLTTAGFKAMMTLAFSNVPSPPGQLIHRLAFPVEAAGPAGPYTQPSTPSQFF
jgi:hypothetical protein